MVTYTARTGGVPHTPTIVEALTNGYREAAGVLGQALQIELTDKTVLQGCEILTPAVNQLNITAGWLVWNGELYPVLPAPTNLVATDATTCSLYVVTQTVVGTMLGLEDDATPVAHVQRRVLQLALTGNVPGGAVAFVLSDLVYLDLAQVCEGDFKDWTVPAGKVLATYFDANGEGLGKQRGWCIARGQTIEGVVMPDERGRVSVAAGVLQIAPGVEGGTYTDKQKLGNEKVQIGLNNLPAELWAPVKPAPKSDMRFAINTDSNNIGPNVDNTGVQVTAGVAVENRQPSSVKYRLYRYK